MIIAALNESPNESRVAITPAAVKHYIQLGFKVYIEENAGIASGFANKAYEDVEAHVISNRQELLKNTNVVVLVNAPNPDDLTCLPPEALVVAPVDNDPDSALIKWCCAENISLISMNLIPRISRAQSLDSLSSQANLAGYRAVLEGIHHFNRAIPMMMTAAGMIQPAKILILGAGVAGLQAIATAKRLGAVVYAFDVRRAAKEQVESLGAEFIEVEDGADLETAGGYANEMSEDYKARQAALIHKYAKLSDIVITTALIPGRKAPILITRQTVEEMKPGSVIVDLATARGGNCELSEVDRVIKHGEVTLVGYSNVAGLVPATASELYANNLVHLIRLITVAPTALVFNAEDEIIQQAMLCHEGNYMPFQAAKEA
ncbi:NAD(P) transhydrogenase subunit alpha [Legionella beliardensis]|uniref:NAD(P) transhydrogenase subunit alpha part 1 n=1 Tax=Legionella beliardensis TaxID=91822 RepID=A0A378HZR0_9GAMM|nr:Re/Si-specific NAD(P)(+) transhydrogenase subunit alpha [Legionella beliardensis]STX28417.1 NAD(P) transhydrogenase subunit alpha [Legionella beliardensis]